MKCKFVLIDRVVNVMLRFILNHNDSVVLIILKI